jgi:serine/threonine protein phosphatase PrpC
MVITDNGRLSQTTPIGKVSHTGSINQKLGDTIHFAVSSCRGRRQTQEDTFVIEAELRPALDDETETLSPDLLRVLPGHALFAVFDGHGTDFASKYSASHFVSAFCKQSSFLEYSRRFRLDSPQQCNPSGKKKRQPKQYDKADSHDDVDLKSLLANAIESTMIELDANMLREMTSRNNDLCGGKLDTCSRDDQTELYDIFDSGTTAIVVLLTPQYFVCANLVSLLETQILILYPYSTIDK